jgi:hypothetical protein
VTSLCETNVKSVQEIKKGLTIPDHFYDEEVVKTDEDFDVNSYFDILEHLSVEPGYYIDYVYFWGFSAQWPVIYASPNTQPPYKSQFDLFERVTGIYLNEEEYGWGFYFGFPDFDFDQKEYLNHIVVDDTAEGYFQYILLSIIGNQFYLYWHAHYNDDIILCNDESLEELDSPLGEKIPKEILEQAEHLDLKPKVSLEENTATVRIVTFSNWGGFTETIYEVSREFPHIITELESNVLLEYDCGIMF